MEHITFKIFVANSEEVFYRSEWNYKGTMNPFEYWYEKKSKHKKICR